MSAGQRYRPGSDEMILDRIKADTLRVDTETGAVSSWRKGRWNRIAQEVDRNGYASVRIYCRGRRRRIAVNRIVWMAEHRELIPEGFDVHHQDTERHNNNGRNLRLLPEELNRGRNEELIQLYLDRDDLPSYQDFIESVYGEF